MSERDAEFLAARERASKLTRSAKTLLCAWWFADQAVELGLMRKVAGRELPEEGKVLAAHVMASGFQPTRAECMAAAAILMRKPGADADDIVKGLTSWLN